MLGHEAFWNCLCGEMNIRFIVLSFCLLLSHLNYFSDTFLPASRSSERKNIVRICQIIIEPQATVSEEGASGQE